MEIKERKQSSAGEELLFNKNSRMGLHSLCGVGQCVYVWEGAGHYPPTEFVVGAFRKQMAKGL